MLQENRWQCQRTWHGASSWPAFPTLPLQQEEAGVLVDALLEHNALELLVHRLTAFNEAGGWRGTAGSRSQCHAGSHHMAHRRDQQAGGSISPAPVGSCWGAGSTM